MAGRDRKKQLARQRYERQVARQAAQRQRARRMKIIGSVVAVVLVVGASAGLATVIGGDSEPKGDAAAAAPTDQPTTPAPQPSVSVKPGECAYLPNSEQGAKDVGTPAKKPAYKGAAQATLKTSLGEIVVDLDGGKAPCTVSSLAFLAKKNFFDDTKCHRLTTEGIKVLQCGDPTGSGAGGPAYRFANENTKGAKYDRGTLAMAHSAQPDSNGSQFFIVYGDSPLPADYTVFGKVVKGLDVVDEVAKAGSDDAAGQGDGAPKKQITIQDVAVAKK
ncbi:peptidylprolyl isomerase [Actinomadura alba]|uniref:peptidylprolyl isomerase n=1 Tax=Actinomadura alba TaxID=406431 RepID=UPI0031DDBCB8